MKYRRIGKTEIEVSEIGLGCWTLGGLNWNKGVSIGWAEVDPSETKEAIHYALDVGVNHFDNADVYGNGKAERILAEALGGKSNDVIIATKVGWFPGTAKHAYDPLHIRHQCEMSLKNLNRDYIDIYYFHHGDFGENDHYLDDAVETMNLLKEEGKIRAIGQSAYTNEDFLKLIPRVKPDVLQSFANAMDDHFISDNSPVRTAMEENGITFVAFSPLAQGLLLDKYKKDNPPKFENGDHRSRSEKFTAKYLAELEPKIEKLKSKFGSNIDDLARAALQYLLHYPVVSSVIPGFRNLKQVKNNLAGHNKPLTEEEFNFIRNVFSE